MRQWEPSRLFDLTGRTAVVIGGTGTLGRAMAKGLAAAGAKVVIVGRDAAKGADAMAELAADGHAALFEPANATARDELEALRDRVHAHDGRIDILINAAGINSSTPFLEITEDEFDRILAVNLKSVFLACQVFGDYFLTSRRSAAIVNMGSMAGLNPLSRVATYSASKAAVHNISRYLAQEWAHQGIRVNTLVPGFIPAEQNRAILQPERIRAIHEHTPLGRFGSPEELIGPLLLLVSDAGRFLTGTELVVDGGFQAKTI